MNRLWAGFLLLAPAVLHAQSGATVGLSDPVLKRAPARSEWVIEFQENRAKVLEAVEKGSLVVKEEEPAAGTEKPLATLPRSITVTKDGNTYREVVLRWNAQTKEKWVVGDLQVYEVPASGQVARAIIPTGSSYSDTYTDYRRSDFEELEWVSRDNFVGVKEVDGRKVLEFRADAGKRRLTPRERSEMVDADKKQSAAELTTQQTAQSGGRVYTAYLDLGTQLPVYFDDGQLIRVYKFAQTPPTDLVIPPRFAGELDAWKKQMVQRPFPKP